MAGRELTHLTEFTFSPDRTKLVAVEACLRAGLDPAGMVLLRHQTNAVYQLITTPVIVKVVRPGIKHTEDVVKLVRWLAEQNVPTVSLLDIEQPMHVAGCAVTLWRYLPQDQAVSAGDIAEPLLSLHSLKTVPLELPQLDALRMIRHSIDASTIVSESERTVLEEFLNDVAARLRFVETSEPRLIHGDPQHRNTLWDNDVQGAVLCDWESAVFGPVEWDLVTIEVHCRRFGFGPGEYHQFCQRYGRDVREWQGYEAFKDLRELRMITTNARKSASGTPQATEVHRRIAQLSEDANARWYIL
ncbi:aminoglycoside phosphotransferase family protein [Lentzea sp. NEAU-D13]|uniref:Aminoglycoside phosphotransferase family protein n=1 Tax=Lentzea alba TaxID=2714351 RepID=A0A7C9RR01_9PSEU|nr:aminoglycoside phosphotransferase family protein [Lentzea alba]NGY61251.1 aminoglycoside phosphotransferase family protein [Lentzea alba]